MDKEVIIEHNLLLNSIHTRGGEGKKCNSPFGNYTRQSKPVMGKLRAAIISDKIRGHLGNSNLGKSYDLTLTEKASLTNLLEVSEGNYGRGIK